MMEFNYSCTIFNDTTTILIDAMSAIYRKKNEWKFNVKCEN